MLKIIIKFFDKLEDHVRGYLSHRPILYTLIGGTAIVLFWYGVWEVAVQIHLNAILAIIISVAVLLVTGLFVSFFIGDTIIISGLRHEKKLTEKTETEIQEVTDDLADIKKELHEVKDILKDQKTKR